MLPTAFQEPLNVLLVEDSPFQVRILECVLEDSEFFSLGHVAEDGVTCLEFLHQADDSQLPDVILCDLNMPRMDGFEVLGDVKNHERLRRIPFVIFTTSSDEKEVTRAYRAGANSFISKPVSLDDLSLLLENFAAYWMVAKCVATGDLDGAVACLQHDVQFKQQTLKSFLPETVQVLLVEDSATQANLIRGLLADVGSLHVSTVPHGEAAMTFLRRQAPYENVRRPHLILLDINLPGKNGFDVLHEIKRDADLSAIPVVTLTVRNALSDIARAYDLGANTFLSKPVDAEQFKHVLRRIAAYWTDQATKLPSAE